MKECQIRHEVQDDVDVLYLDGAMDSFSFPRLESTLNGLRDAQRHRVVLECTGLEFINSAALGALIGYARRARDKGGDLKLAAMRPKLLNIVELLGFDRILQTFGSARQAVEQFARV